MESLPKLTHSVLHQLQQIADPHDLVASLKVIFPDEALKALKSSPAIERRLRMAFTNEPARVRSLEASKFTDVSDIVQRADFNDWRSRLRRLRTEAIHAASKRHLPKDDTANVEADAWTMAYLQTLYRDSNSCNENRRVAFLFVTADLSIIKAAEEKEDILLEEGIPNFVRHPRVYSPILNPSSMAVVGLKKRAHARELADIFYEVEAALDRLLVFGSPHGSPVEQASAMSLTRNLDRWASAARELFSINAHFFAEDDEAFREVARLCAEPAVLQAAGKRLKKTVSDIKMEHVRIQTARALSDLTDLLVDEARKGGEAAADKRIPLKLVGVDRDIHKLLHPSWWSLRGCNDASTVDHDFGSLQSLMDALGSRGNEENGHQDIKLIGDKLVSRWDHPVTQLVAAGLYLQLGKWQSAHDCAARCQTLILAGQEHETTEGWLKDTAAKQRWRREANDCFSLTGRMLLRTISQFIKAKNILQTNISEWEGDQTADGRAAVLRIKWSEQRSK